MIVDVDFSCKIEACWFTGAGANATYFRGAPAMSLQIIKKGRPSGLPH